MSNLLVERIIAMTKLIQKSDGQDCGEILRVAYSILEDYLKLKKS